MWISGSRIAFPDALLCRDSGSELCCRDSGSELCCRDSGSDLLCRDSGSEQSVRESVLASPTRARMLYSFIARWLRAKSSWASAWRMRSSTTSEPWPASKRYTAKSAPRAVSRAR